MVAISVATVGSVNINSMRLAGNLRSRRDVGALGRGANGEYRALPLFTLSGQLLVLGSLGADTTR